MFFLLGMLVIDGSSEHEILVKIASMRDYCQHGPECASCSGIRRFSAVAAIMVKSGDVGVGSVGRCVAECQRRAKLEPSAN